MSLALKLALIPVVLGVLCVVMFAVYFLGLAAGCVSEDPANNPEGGEEES